VRVFEKGVPVTREKERGVDLRSNSARHDLAATPTQAGVAATVSSKLLRAERHRFATHAGIEVRKVSLWGVLPGPDVHFVERRQAIAIRLADIVQQVSFEVGRALHGRCKCDELDADEPPAAVRLRFVDQGFGLVGFYEAVTEAVGQEQVYAHRAFI